MEFRGKLTQWMYPRHGWCARCQTSWALVEGFSVPYHSCTEAARTNNGQIDIYGRREDDYSCSGLFAICTECWNKLTPEGRLPYYADLYWGHYRDYYSNPAYPDMAKTRQQAELEWEEIETRIRTNNMKRRYTDGLATPSSDIHEGSQGSGLAS